MLESGFRLFRQEPDFSDLALTPMQRKLLGLNPNGSSFLQPHIPPLDINHPGYSYLKRPTRRICHPPALP